MSLQGQDGERGFAMAALLVSLAVMSVLMSVALPTWRHQVQREKEAELIFRGEQYARAVALFRSKNGNNFPPSVDVLVRGKYLRKKYLDPVTGKDFEVIGVGQAQTAPGAAAAPGTAPQTPPPGQAGQVAGGVMGVRSRSDATSIRIYNNQNKYNLWTFVFTAANRPGGNVGEGADTPGGRGVPQPDGRGGRGVGPGSGPGTAPGRGGGRAVPDGRGFRPGGSPQGPGRGGFPPPGPGSGAGS
jgi:type II secretory pathway pseudopilin PulG